eukprot:TRINITY_DN7982_c1_g2_i1.p1 TRINITY_DN7982_c1_g2~~TRINITY_DN7982_c1_g2_i1.p1  ORF type:complete len:288 (+),score=45.05 TRINITY_DN7982_c1_g2_i1:77-865(+)
MAQRRANSYAAPYATRPAKWEPTASSEYGKTSEGDGVVLKHKQDVLNCFNQIRWGGLPPGAPRQESTSLPRPQSRAMVAPLSPAKAVESHSEDNVAMPNIMPERESINIDPIESSVPKGYGFGMYPHASRGKAAGSQKSWAFERNPALLPQPLQRGCRACGVAPADSSPQWPKASSTTHHIEKRLDALAAANKRPPDKSNSTSGLVGSLWVKPSGAPASSLTRVASEPRFSGMHGMIGLGWDGAKRTAGDRYSGSAGEFLGF